MVNVGRYTIHGCYGIVIASSIRIHCLASYIAAALFCSVAPVKKIYGVPPTSF